MLAITGGGFLALAMTGAVWLVTGFLFGDGVTAPVVAVTLGLFAVVWYVVPLVALRGLPRDR